MFLGIIGSRTSSTLASKSRYPKQKKALNICLQLTVRLEVISVLKVSVKKKERQDREGKECSKRRINFNALLKIE